LLRCDKRRSCNGLHLYGAGVSAAHQRWRWDDYAGSRTREAIVLFSGYFAPPSLSGAQRAINDMERADLPMPAPILR
jgi:hypothetical protein